MQSKKFFSLFLVCAMLFALMLTGCNTPVDTGTDETICTCTCTCATADDNYGDDNGDDNYDDGGNVGDDNNGDEGDNGDNGGNATSRVPSKRPNNTRTHASTQGRPTASGNNQPNSTTTKKPTTSASQQGGNQPASSSTTTKRTTTSTTKSTASGSTAKPLLPSFERLADGTCKDRATGEIFIDDDCNAVVSFDENGKQVQNGTKLFASSGVGVDGNQKEFFGNDGGRYLRYPPEAGSWWFTYKLDSGIKEVAIQAFTGKNSSGAVHNGVDIYVSNDNKSWSKKTLSYSAATDTDIGSGWLMRMYTAKSLGGYKYLKVQFTSYPSDIAFYTPNIARVRINNISKMNETDRYLEGRVSKTFYVDPKNGDDKNEGTSQNAPWKSLMKVSSHYYQPGDKILFKAGATFTGNLTINGYGTSDNRLTISTYGGDARAVISARGGVETVMRASVEYATIENLELTGKQATIGLQIGAGHTGANKGIIVQNCYIHDVNINDDQFGYTNAGINLNSTGTEPTWFEGIMVRNNTIKNVARVGIYMTGAWGDRPGCSYGASGGLYKSDTNGWWPNKNCYITNNQLLDVHGDAILVIGGNNITIEKNFVNNAFAVPATKYNYIKSNGWNIAAAAVWVANTNNVIMQNNDVGYTNLPTNFGDGEGFDIDGANKGCTVQYNYSHNNAGGFLLMCEFPESLSFTRGGNHYVRFNLSLNDAQSGHGVFVATTTEANMNIYNNTIIQTSGGAHLFTNWGTIKNMVFTNNIFYGTAAGNLGTGMSATCSNIRFENNVFWGGSGNVNKSGVSMSGKKSQDPKFKNANFSDSKSTGSQISAAINAFVPTNKISGATSIGNHGGKDIAGNAISSTNFYGCHKY